MSGGDDGEFLRQQVSCKARWLAATEGRVKLTNLEWEGAAADWSVWRQEGVDEKAILLVVLRVAELMGMSGGFAGIERWCCSIVIAGQR